MSSFTLVILCVATIVNCIFIIIFIAFESTCPITSDRPDMSCKTQVGQTKYPTTSDRQYGYFFGQFLCSQSKNRSFTNYRLVKFSWSGKSFTFTGPTVWWNFELIGKDSTLNMLFNIGSMEKMCTEILVHIVLSSLESMISCSFVTEGKWEGLQIISTGVCNSRGH